MSRRAHSTELGADVEAIGDAPNGDNINVGCGATDLAALQRIVTSGHYDLGVAFDGDGDRMLAVDENGAIVDGDQIVAILALHLDVDLVAVTTMANLGFHRLMEERGVRVITTDVGDRYVLEALYREGGILGGEQSGHVICLRDHVTGDGLAAALLLCEALARPHAVGGCRRDGALPAGEAELAPLRARASTAGIARPHRRRQRGTERRRPCARAAVRHGARRSRTGRSPNGGGGGSPLC